MKVAPWKPHGIDRRHMMLLMLVHYSSLGVRALGGSVTHGTATSTNAGGRLRHLKNHKKFRSIPWRVERPETHDGVTYWSDLYFGPPPRI